MPAEEIDCDVAGINHLAFFLRLERGGEDPYPALRAVDPPEGNRVRYEVMRHLGDFVTESSEHFAEYVPWFIKAGRPELIERFDIPLDEYMRRCEAQIAEWDGDARGLRTGAPRSPERARVRRRHRARVRDRRAVPLQRQRPEPLRRRAADRQPAAGLLRRGPVRGRARGISRSRSARFRAISPR